MKVNKRNMMVIEAIKSGRNPVMEYELDSLNQKFSFYVQEQKKLAKQLQEAMSQSSETWHDNGPAEVIIAESEILSQSAEQLSEFIAKSFIISGEAPRGQISLGSVCKVLYVDEEEEVICIAGVTSVIPDEVKNVFADIQAVSVKSPMALHLLGKTKGNRVSFSISSGARSLAQNVVIIDIL